MPTLRVKVGQFSDGFTVEHFGKKGRRLLLVDAGDKSTDVVAIAGLHVVVLDPKIAELCNHGAIVTCELTIEPHVRPTAEDAPAEPSKHGVRHGTEAAAAPAKTAKAPKDKPPKAAKDKAAKAARGKQQPPEGGAS